MSASVLRIGQCRRQLSSALNLLGNCYYYHHSLRHQRFLQPAVSVTSVVGHSSTWHQSSGGIVSRVQHRHLHMPVPFKRKQDYRRIDQMPMTHEMVYSSAFSIYISYFYPFTAFAATNTVILATYIYSTNDQISITDDAFHMFEDMMEVFVAVPAIQFLAYLAWMIAKRSPLRIYHQVEDNTFVAIFATLLPWKVAKLEFAAGDVRDLYVHEKEDQDNPQQLFRGLVSVFRGRYILGKRRLSLVTDSFKYPHSYNVMMGYLKQTYQDDDDES